MANSIIKLLHGDTSTLSSVAQKPGQVYFALSGLSGSTPEGKLYFDAPSGTSSKRVAINDHVSLADKATAADSATKATQDAGGRVIANTYLSSISFDGTTNKATKVTMAYASPSKSGGGNATLDVPTASASSAGMVTTGTQTFTGAKTIDANGSLTIAKASGFNYSGIAADTSTNAATTIWFSKNGTIGTPVRSTNFTYNPSTGTVKATTFDGNATTATKATKDGAGNTITTTYLNKVQVASDGYTIQYTTAGNATGVNVGKFAPLDTDNKIPLDYIPATAIERLVTVADDTARYKLTINDVQLGDLVKVSGTGKLYAVKDTANLAAAAGYEEITASTSWSNLTGKPTTFLGSGTTISLNTAGTGIILTRKNEAGTTGTTTTITPKFLPLAGGTMDTTAVITWNLATAPSTFPSNLGGLTWTGSDDSVKLFASATSAANLDLVLQFINDNSNGLSIRNKDNTQTAYIAATGNFTTRQLTPQANNTYELGTSSLKWKNIYSAGGVYAASVSTTTVTASGKATLSEGTDSTNSTTAASLKVTGGASIGKQLSAKSIRIDNGQTAEGCQIVYNETQDCIQFNFT